MKITKKQIKEATLTSELQSSGAFCRRFKHYFEINIEHAKYHKLTFSMSGNKIDVTSFNNRLNDEPDYSLLHTDNGKKGFINEVYDFITSL